MCRRRWRRYERWDHERSELGRAREDDVQLLEVRLARLEERLEFTEKLLMGIIRGDEHGLGCVGPTADLRLVRVQPEGVESCLAQPE